MVALVTTFPRHPRPTASELVVPSVYGTIAWDEDLTEPTPMDAPAGGRNDGPTLGVPRIARGVTRAITGGANRTDASGLTLGTDGTIAYTGPGARPILCLATVTLSHGDFEFPFGGGQALLTKTLGLHLYRAGSPVRGAVVYSDVTNMSDAAQASPGFTGYGQLSLSAIVEFKPGQSARLMISNESDRSDVTLVAGTFTLVSI